MFIVRVKLACLCGLDFMVEDLFFFIVILFQNLLICEYVHTINTTKN